MATCVQSALERMQTRVLQVISIGDRLHYLEAAHVLARAVSSGARYLKTVKMMAAPTARDLTVELKILAQKLHGLACKAKSLECVMGRQKTECTEHPAPEK